MRSKNGKMSKRTLALIAVAALLFASGGFMGTRAQLTTFSSDMVGEFELDHLQVHLLENGRDVCGGGNTLDGASKTEGDLLGYMSGKVTPGRVYKEEIAAMNGTGASNESVDQFVRLTIRKYWRDPAGKKDPNMDPDLIKLTYNSSDYNTGSWILNNKETTPERTVYYYKNALKGQEKTAPVVNRLQVDGAIVKDVKTTEKDNVITYEYEYDGYSVCVEADVQAVQTHNANGDADYAALRSIWGVDNVFVNGNTLSVSN